MAKDARESRLFGLKLQALRERAGLSQDALAKAIGVPQTFISRWERGERTPMWSAIQKLAVALDVSTEAFRTDDTDDTDEAETPTPPKRGRPRKSAE
jgi:transcriptional regulator with XRE-family HTH domain